MLVGEICVFHTLSVIHNISQNVNRVCGEEA